MFRTWGGAGLNWLTTTELFFLNLGLASPRLEDLPEMTFGVTAAVAAAATGEPGAAASLSAAARVVLSAAAACCSSPRRRSSMCSS